MHFCLKNRKIMITDKDYNFEESLLLNDPIEPKEVYRCEYIEFPSSEKVVILVYFILIICIKIVKGYYDEDYISFYNLTDTSAIALIGKYYD